MIRLVVSRKGWRSPLLWLNSRLEGALVWSLDGLMPRVGLLFVVRVKVEQIHALVFAVAHNAEPRRRMQQLPASKVARLPGRPMPISQLKVQKHLFMHGDQSRIADGVMQEEGATALGEYSGMCLDAQWQATCYPAERESGVSPPTLARNSKAERREALAPDQRAHAGYRPCHHVCVSGLFRRLASVRGSDGAANSLRK